MGDIILAGSTSGSITVAPPAVAGSGTLTLPAVTDTLVGLAATQTLTNKSIVATQLTGTVAAARLPAGSVVQVVSVAKTSYFSSSATSYTDVTGLAVTITPASASNTILVFLSGVLGASSGAITPIRLVRGATSIALGDAAGSRIQASAGMNRNNDDTAAYTFSLTFLDSPATTAATTYKVQAYSNVAWSVGGNSTNTDVTTTGRYPSTITVMEIQG